MGDLFGMHKHHIVHRGQGGLDFPLNMVELTMEERERRTEKIIKILEGQGMSPAPEDAWDELYKKYEKVDSIYLEEDCCEDFPKEYGCNPGELMFFVRYGCLYIIREKEEEEEQEAGEDMARQQRERNRRQIGAVVKEMDARRRGFIEDIIRGGIAPAEETASLYADIWKCMLSVGVGVRKEAMYGFFTEKSRWELSGEEEEELERKIDGMTAIQQMLVILDGSVHGCQVCSYDGTFDRDAAGRVKPAYEILKKYGWSFTEEEERVLDGTHELYADEED